MQICFMLTSNTVSGGIFTVFKHAAALARKGHDVTIAFMLDDNLETRPQFDGLDQVRFASWREVCGTDTVFDIAVATWWETMYLLPQVRAAHYAYFVQGFEDEFYKPGSLPASLVPATYETNVHMLTVSKALSDRLKQKYRSSSIAIPCGIELARFGAASPAIPKSKRLRAMVEGQPDDERKMVRFTLEVLSKFDDLEILYVSPAGRPSYEARIGYFFQAVHQEDMPALYASCDFLVKLSRTESFALPVLEMFATGGTAIVSAFKGHDEYIVDRENALVVPIGDRGATARAVQEMIADRELRERLSGQALMTAQRFSLERSTAAFEKALTDSVETCAGCRNLEPIERNYERYKSFDLSLLSYNERMHKEKDAAGESSSQ